jgi:protein-disulfide isomerase
MDVSWVIDMSVLYPPDRAKGLAMKECESPGNAEKKPSAQFLAEPVTEQDHALGPVDAPITIIEYGDYECPTCLNAVPIVRKMREALGDRARFIFRHYPQSSIHPHASAAAEAAEAAAEQGKFWAMHEALFAHQAELATIDLSHLALTLGLEIYEFETARSRDKHRKHIAEDFASGQRSGVNKTPTFFINGKRYEGKIEPEGLVEEALAAAGG